MSSRGVVTVGTLILILGLVSMTVIRVGVETGEQVAWRLAILLAVAGAIAAAASLAVAREQTRRAHAADGSTLAAKVDALRANLQSSGELIGEINSEFDLQVAAAERIKAEAEQNQRLAELTRIFRPGCGGDRDRSVPVFVG